MLLRFIPYVGPLLLLQALSACSGENNGAGETNVAANPPAPAAGTAPVSVGKLVLAFGDSLYAGYGVPAE